MRAQIPPKHFIDAQVVAHGPLPRSEKEQRLRLVAARRHNAQGLGANSLKVSLTSRTVALSFFMRARNSSSSVAWLAPATAALSCVPVVAFKGVWGALDCTFFTGSTCAGSCGAALCTMVEVTFCRLSLIDFFSKYSFCSCIDCEGPRLCRLSLNASVSTPCMLSC